MEGFYSSEELKSLGLKAVGRDVLISKKASIYLPEKISIGDHVRIDDFCFLVGNITLENYIHISPYSSIHGTGGGTVTMKDFAGLSSYSTVYAASDEYSGEKMTNPLIDEEYRKVVCSDIIMEKHSVVGVHSVLLPGAYLAEGTAIGAMSLVSKPTEAWGIYIGVPARRIKDRKKDCLYLEREFLRQKIEKKEFIV
ncbi:MAG: acyltransferase [Oscillibacter sp.]|jgi:acetyltransferase-like isoleucine patch superfamily enzyme|nr:acyltransferase [Oscillibacter sp.]MCI8690236.1 acyltransferase [Oscillibacter sp.]